ncbi:hypothetical protein BCAH1134_C0766 (plasmid) [Bacillus cereus AH1134]|nr:hypothetical protein BCAH1134_C0766 [Bacillus cereus AH1134]
MLVHIIIYVIRKIILFSSFEFNSLSISFIPQKPVEEVVNFI